MNINEAYANNDHIWGVGTFPKKTKMAGQHEDFKNNKRDFKDIGTIRHEIRDPDIERNYSSLSLRKDGSLLATDDENNEVCIFNKNGKLVESFEATFDLVTDIVELSDGNIAVSHFKDIKVYTPHGVLVKKIGSDVLDNPAGLAVNNKGQLFVVDRDICDVFVYSEDGEFQYSFGSRGSDLGEFKDPFCICIGQDGLVYIVDTENNCVLVFQQDGQFVQTFGKDVLQSLYLYDIATFEDGHIVVASSGTDKLSIFTTSGECVHNVKDVGLSDPYGIVVDKNGFIFVADYNNHRIVMF